MLESESLASTERLSRIEYRALFQNHRIDIIYVAWQTQGLSGTIQIAQLEKGYHRSNIWDQCDCKITSLGISFSL